MGHTHSQHWLLPSSRGSISKVLLSQISLSQKGILLKKNFMGVILDTGFIVYAIKVIDIWLSIALG
jgi:hypothetical protein